MKFHNYVHTSENSKCLRLLQVKERARLASSSEESASCASTWKTKFCFEGNSYLSFALGHTLHHDKIEIVSIWSTYCRILFALNICKIVCKK